MNQMRLPQERFSMSALIRTVWEKKTKMEREMALVDWRVWRQIILEFNAEWSAGRRNF